MRQRRCAWLLASVSTMHDHAASQYFSAPFAPQVNLDIRMLGMNMHKLRSMFALGPTQHTHYCLYTTHTCTSPARLCSPWCEGLVQYTSRPPQRIQHLHSGLHRPAQAHLVQLLKCRGAGGEYTDAQATLLMLYPVICCCYMLQSTSLTV
jgi:hypothetical protein